MQNCQRSISRRRNEIPARTQSVFLCRMQYLSADYRLVAYFLFESKFRLMVDPIAPIVGKDLSFDFRLRAQELSQLESSYKSR